MGGINCVLQIPRSNILHRLIRAEQRKAIHEAHTALIGIDCGGEAGLVCCGSAGEGGGLDGFALLLCRAEEGFDVLVSHFGVIL